MAVSDRILAGVKKAIDLAGFDAQIQRETGSTIDPDNPLGQPIMTTETVDCRVFVDKPRTQYVNGALVTIGDGTLYVDLLSCVGFTPSNGDVLLRPDGREQTLSNVETNEADGLPVISMAVVTG